MNSAANSGSAAAMSVDTELEQLRHILLGEDFQRLLRLRDEINDDEAFSQRIARVIARAMELRTESDTAIAEVLAPIIDQAVTGSVANDPERLANSIYPIMGPAIRKSISEAINELLENFNNMLTLGLSMESLGWRYKAWRTGRSYGEVALLNSLVYRVEQVFLIHRETGLLLEHVAAEQEDTQDPDMVSGMLSAIESFIGDSFTVEDGKSLDTMKLGDLTVLVQQGPYATIAAVVRGPLPADLRGRLTASLERIHLRRNRELQQFEGDASVFDEMGPEMETLLLSQRREKKRKTPWVALLVIGVLLVLAGWWWYQGYERDQLVESMATELEQQPGLILLNVRREDDIDVFQMLADPDAADPTRLLQDAFPAASDYRVEQRGHISLDSEIISLKLDKVLNPPEGVSLTLDAGVLSVAGRADNYWAEDFNLAWRTIPGVDSADTSGLEVFYPDRDAEAARLRVRQSLISVIENTRLEFDVASTEIGAYSNMIPELARQINELDRQVLEQSGRHVRIDVVGFTDESGSRSVNHEIGTDRAETVRGALVQAGVDPEILNASDSLDYYNVDVSSERLVKLFVYVD